MRKASIFVSIVLFVGLELSAAVYRHASPKFSVEYDEKEWQVPKTSPRQEKEDVDRKMAGATLFVLSRIEGDDKYHSRFSVVVDEKFKEKGAEQLKLYVADATKFLKDQGFDLNEPKQIQLPHVALPAFEIQGRQRHLGLTFLQVVFVREGQTYLLTTAARTKKFEEQAKSLRSVINSFRFN